MLDSFLIDKLSVEIFEKQIFSSDFHPISEYMFRLFFLTTLNIYKDCLRVVTDDATQCKSFSQANCKPETYALVHLSIQKVVVYVHRKVL